MAYHNIPQLTSKLKAELKVKLEAIYKPLLEQDSFQARYEGRSSTGERDVLVVTSEETIGCLRNIIWKVKQMEGRMSYEVWQIRQEFDCKVWKGTIVNNCEDGRIEMWVVPMKSKPEEGSVNTYSVKEITIETDVEKYIALVNITLNEDDCQL